MLYCSAFSFITNAQDTTKVSWPLIVYASGGQSTFKCDPSGPEPSKFPTAEFRLGAGTSYTINDYFELRTRLVFGVKMKRESVNKPGQPVTVGSPYFSLDETASNINHFFYEVPILFQFNFPHPKIGLRAGPSFRSFFPNNDNVDLLVTKKEIGINLGAYVKAGDHFRIGADYYLGTRVIYNSYVTIDNESFELKVRNRGIVVNVEYSF